jgi:hypothetical protein
MDVTIIYFHAIFFWKSFIESVQCEPGLLGMAGKVKCEGTYFPDFRKVMVGNNGKSIADKYDL